MTTKAISMSALLLSIAIAMPAVAETWRWVDAEGVVNYSERKPKDVDAELVGEVRKAGTRRRVRDEAPPAPPPAIPGATQAQPDLTARQQEMLAELENAEADRQTQVAQLREENCATARRVLENLTVRDRVRVRMENGTTRVLEEEERQARIADAQQGIVVNCDS